MEVKLHEITVRQLVEGYENREDEGVVGFGGKLDIRPPYQREFIYSADKQKAVIDTIFKNFPLNIMYWVKRDDGTFEVMDGQQRTMSICEYYCCNFSIEKDGYLKGYDNLTDKEQEDFLNYKLMVYFCEGNDYEKLQWFKTINIAGEDLSDQEMRNAVYNGSWVNNAKVWFSKKVAGCPAYQVGSPYIASSVKINRQGLLELAIKWISKGNINEYMKQHQHDKDATELWNYYKSVIEWAENLFGKPRKEMKGLPWGEYYNEYKDQEFNPEAIRQRVDFLMQDEEIENKKGIYLYVLDGKEKHLNLRQFPENIRRTVYEKQEGKCFVCKKEFEFEEMEGDHWKSWHKGGKTEIDNCRMLCRDCNREKSGK
ncbi:MAG: DUF262 domain-containing protein [Bacteroidales bacterium]|nr:DUF262 domain-containing protein [Bacteroidales bacterium]